MGGGGGEGEEGRRGMGGKQNNEIAHCAGQSNRMPTGCPQGVSFQERKVKVNAGRRKKGSILLCPSHLFTNINL